MATRFAWFRHNDSGEQPCLNNSLQLTQGQKTMGLLTGD